MSWNLGYFFTHCNHRRHRQGAVVEMGIIQHWLYGGTCVDTIFYNVSGWFNSLIFKIRAQNIIVFTLLSVVVVYVVYSFVKKLRFGSGNACHGCSGCQI